MHVCGPVCLCVCSSQQDLKQDLFWPSESAQLSEAGQAQHPRGSSYYKSHCPDSDSYPSSGTYGNSDHPWPTCVGSCFAGECGLDQTRPGCCCLQGRAYDSAANAAAWTAEVSGGVGGYWEHAGRNKVCWRDANGTPYTV
jgi:hypothetical protein